MNCCVTVGSTPLAAVIVKGNRPTVPAGIVPDSTPVAAFIVTHEGWPLSEKLGAGSPVAVTEKAKLPVESSTESDAADVIASGGV